MVAGRPGKGALLARLGGDVSAGSLAACGRPQQGGTTGVDAAVPVCSLRRSTVTAWDCPPMLILKYLCPLSMTLLWLL